MARRSDLFSRSQLGGMMRIPSLPFARIFTFSTDTRPPRVDVGIFRIKQMTVQAVRIVSSFLLVLQTACVKRRSAVTSIEVFLLRDYFHVPVINAISGSTQMINLVATWYLSVCRLVRKSMSAYCSSVEPETSVSSRVTGSHPYPARAEAWHLDGAVFVNFGPEPLRSWHLHSLHCNPTLPRKSRVTK